MLFSFQFLKIFKNKEISIAIDTSYHTRDWKIHGVVLLHLTWSDPNELTVMYFETLQV